MKTSCCLLGLFFLCSFSTALAQDLSREELGSPQFPIDSLLSDSFVQSLPDSLLLLELKRQSAQANSTIKAQLADRMMTQHYQRFLNNDFDHALQYLQLAEGIWEALDSMDRMTECLYRMGLNYFRLGEMFEAYENTTRSIELAVQRNNMRYYIFGHSRLAWIYSRLDQFDKAIEAITIYKNKGDEYFDNDRYLRFYHNALASFYYRKKEFEVARLHVDSAIQLVIADGDQEDYATYLSNKSMYYPNKDSLSERLVMQRKSFSINKKYNNRINLAENYLSFGELFLLSASYDSCIFYLNEGLQLYDEIDNKSRTYEANKYLADAYQALGQYDKAFEAKKIEAALYDEVYGIQELGKVFELEKQLSIKTADEQIAKLESDKNYKAAEFQKSKTKLVSLIFVLLFFTILGWFYLYRKRQKQKVEQLLIERELQQEVVELEKKALRAQMNPHFLFNSFNSIKSYIANNEPRLATKYLNKFAQLMRMILRHSQEKKVSLKDELKALQLYTELEQSRLNDQFTFDFIIDDQLDVENVYVPPLIVQPFIENSIWHGLMPKDGEKYLSLHFIKKSELLHIKVKDNGIGREASMMKNNKEKNKHRSYGLKITNDRLKLNNAEMKTGSDQIIIRDLVDAEGNGIGTEVIMNLPINTTVL